MEIIAPGGHVIEGLEDQSYKLRDFEFTDLYISPRGKGRVRGSTLENEPLVDVPGELIFEIEALRRQAMMEGGSRDEFALVYDEIPFRVSKIPAQAGEVLVFRRLFKKIPRLVDLKLRPMIARSLLYVASRGSGLILVSGATGSGKTTTVGSILQEYLIRIGDVAVTIEDPPELPLEKQYPKGECYQMRVENGDFALSLKKALRYRPKYILVGEIRDPASASELLRAAQSGHICLATIHSSSIEQSLTALLKYVAKELNFELASEMLASSVAAVVNQRLISVKTNDVVTRRPLADALFFRGNERGLPAYIRDGNIAGLNNEIDRQKKLIERNLDPFHKEG